MGKLRFLLLIALTVVFLQAKAAWVEVVNDPRTTGQVTANVTAQKLIEDQHNKRLDSIKTKQNRIKMYTEKMSVVKELYKFSMQNISGFGEESKIYVEMFNATVDIFKNVPIAFNTLNKFPGKNHLLCMNELEGLVEETVQCVSLFKNIVNNGKVKSPIAGEKASEVGNKDDGYNFMDRWTRYSLANTLLSKLLNIKYKLQGIVIMCKYCNTMSNLAFTLDVESWMSYFAGKNIVEGLISDWKGLGS